MTKEEFVERALEIKETWLDKWFEDNISNIYDSGAFDVKTLPNHYVNGVAKTWEEVTEQKDYKQRIVNKSFSHVRNMVVSNGKVTINGMSMEDWYGRDEIAIIHVTINGSVEKLKMDSCETITVHGNVGDIETISGKVSVSGDVKGDVETMSGSVTASKIYGDVSTMSGDITDGKL